MWSAVANRCLPDVNEIANLAVSITNANNETVSENQLQKGLEFVLHVQLLLDYVQQCKSQRFCQLNFTDSLLYLSML